MYSPSLKPYVKKSIILISVLFLAFGILALPASVLAGDRSDFVLQEIENKNQDISAGDRQTKYCNMAASPFVFYRGTAHLFWADFAQDSKLKEFGNEEQTKIWLVGDLHSENYGTYDNNKGEVVYNLNDFDEAVVDDYQLDLWRMATSIVLVARQQDLSKSESEDVVDAFTEAYLDAIASYEGNDKELKVEFTAANTDEPLKEFLEKTREKKSRKKLLKKWTEGGKFDFSYQKLGPVTSEERTAITKAMAAYGQTLTGDIRYDADRFQVKDVARRINAGTGSLGTPRYYVLIEGETDSQKDDRILDLKLQGEPTPYAYMSSEDRDRYDRHFEKNHALRYAIGYRALTKNTDNYLGWMQLDIQGKGYYSVREISPFNEGFKSEGKSFKKLAEQWGEILATAHARSDKDFDATYVPYSFDKQVAKRTDGKHKEFRALVRNIAFSYADRVNSDWEIFLKSLPKNYCNQ